MIISDTTTVKEVKKRVNTYSTENGRIPQNLMTTSAPPWVHNRVIHFTVYPKRLDGKMNNSSRLCCLGMFINVP